MRKGKLTSDEFVRALPSMPSLRSEPIKYTRRQAALIKRMNGRPVPESMIRDVPKVPYAVDRHEVP